MSGFLKRTLAMAQGDMYAYVRHLAGRFEYIDAMELRKRTNLSGRYPLEIHVAYRGLQAVELILVADDGDIYDEIWRVARWADDLFRREMLGPVG